MLRLEARPQPSALWSYGSPILALLLTVVIGVVMFVALGKDPLRGLEMFFWLPISSGYQVGELLVKATPLLIIALGLAICFRSNVWNIGAEGQYVIGAIFAGGVALMADKTTGAWILGLTAVTALAFGVTLPRRRTRLLALAALAPLLAMERWLGPLHPVAPVEAPALPRDR